MAKVLASSLAVFLLTVAVASGHTPGPDKTVVVVAEGSDAVLRCSPNPLQSLVQELFDWMKEKKTDEQTDFRKNVFLYNKGKHYNNGPSDQDQQFKGRVSHFPDQLVNGNGSIIIRNTTIKDAGDYTCVLPHLLGGEQKFSIKLIVEETFRDRSGERSGVAPEPYVSIHDISESGVQLNCEAKGALPRPDVLWLGSNGTVLSAEEPKVVESRGRYNVTLQTTVIATNGNYFRCVVKQKDFHHEIGRSITVSEKLFEKQDPGSFSRGMVLGVFIGVFIGAFIGVLLFAAGQRFVATKRMTQCLNKGEFQPEDKSSEQPLKQPEDPNSLV